MLPQATLLALLRRRRSLSLDGIQHWQPPIRAGTDGATAHRDARSSVANPARPGERLPSHVQQQQQNFKDLQ